MGELEIATDGLDGRFRLVNLVFGGHFKLKFIAIYYQQIVITIPMKGFTIAELLIYDPTRQSSKRKPIEIDMQQAKIIAYHPHNVELQQKCNTVGMAEGVYNFCHSFLTGKENKEDQQKQRGWQVISMDNCTLILSEVEQNIWIFVKLDHSQQPKYHRLGQNEEHYYYQQSFTEDGCKVFMNSLYDNFKLFYGNVRGWVFKQKFEQLKHVLFAFVTRFQQIYKYENRLDLLSFMMKDLRLIPLDINTTLKFTYFKNVLQSYNSNIAHLIVFAHGILTFTSLGKNTTHLIAKYLFSNGQPYFSSEQLKNRIHILPDLPKNISEKFGVIYNSKVIGFEQNSQLYRVSMNPQKPQGTDLLGLQSQQAGFDFFDIFIEEQQVPMKVSFYAENNMFFVTIFRQKPEPSQLVFQNRFYHDNADKFILKINESIHSVLKPNDPYKFIFHNCATYTGKSTIKQWKNAGYYIRYAFEQLQKTTEGAIATSTQFGYWVYGAHRLSRILILLIPTEVPLGRLEDFVNKMTKEYFSKAFL